MSEVFIATTANHIGSHHNTKKATFGLTASLWNKMDVGLVALMNAGVAIVHHKLRRHACLPLLGTFRFSESANNGESMTFLYGSCTCLSCTSGCPLTPSTTCTARWTLSSQRPNQCCRWHLGLPRDSLSVYGNDHFIMIILFGKASVEPVLDRKA